MGVSPTLHPDFVEVRYLLPVLQTGSSCQNRLTAVGFSVTIAKSKTHKESCISNSTRLNGAIRAPQLRVVDSDGKQLGILSRAEALDLAAEQELDLVEISPNADPPVVKIVDWGKFNYQKTKQQQANKRNTKTLDMKQMRFGLKIGDHDLEVKMKKVAGFLEAGHKVKITLFFRGRELAHKDIGFKLADRVIESFGERIAVDQQPQLNGKQLSFVVRGTGKPAVKHSEAPAPETSNIEPSEPAKVVEKA